VVDPIPVSHCVGSLHPRILFGFTDDIYILEIREVHASRTRPKSDVCLCAVNYQRWAKINTAIDQINAISDFYLQL
jgi:hypothetical protein